jgi:alkaline phosphatase D
VTRQLQDQDAQLARLLSGLDHQQAWRYTTLLVVSDHGMTEIGRYLDIAAALQDAGIAATVTGSAVANVYLDNPAHTDRALDAISALQPAQAYRRDALPDHLRLSHPSRSGDLVVITEPPYSFSRPAGLAGYLSSWLHAVGVSFGGHGYDPRHPDMGGIFLAMGRGVPAELMLPEVYQVDVAPTVARLLRMEPPRQSEGRPVRGIGEHLIGDDKDGADPAAAAQNRNDPQHPRR